MARRGRGAGSVLGLFGPRPVRRRAGSVSSAGRPGISSASKPSCRSRTPIAPRRSVRCRSWSRATTRASSTRSRTVARIVARCFASTSAARRATSSASTTTGATTSPAISPPSPSARAWAERAACRPTRGPTRIRRASCKVETLGGLVFGTLSRRRRRSKHYLGPEIVKGIRRVMRAPVRVLGGYSQMLQSNWKLYMENVKD